MARGCGKKLVAVLRWEDFEQHHGVGPRTREAIGHRHWALRKLEQWSAEGVLADRDKLEAELRGHEAGAYADRPMLHPHLEIVLLLWRSMGSPVTVLGGLASGVIDLSPIFYPMRRAWLDENGIKDSEERADLLFLWQVLDREKVNIEHDRLAKALEKATSK